MIELILTSIPFLLRLLYLRLRHKEVTLYNVHRSLYLWFLLFIALIFTIEYYHPESNSGVVPFRIVPVVAERGGTVTSLHVAAGESVKKGDLLFTVDDSGEAAEVAVEKSRVDSARQKIALAKAEMGEAASAVAAAQAALDEANVQLYNQEQFREENSPAFAQDRYLRALNIQKERAADVAEARAALATARVQAEQLAESELATARASLRKAQVALEKTRIRAPVDGRIEQLTLNVGDRAGQFALSPAMVVVPDRDEEGPAEIVAGFTQVNRSVLEEGMAAEVACASNVNNSMTNSVLPARIVRIQDSIPIGQVAATGRLLQPSGVKGKGDVVVYLRLVYPEHQKLLINGSRCLVQAYTTRIRGSLSGTFLGNVIQAWALEKAVVMRMKVWVMLATGAGLIGDG